MLNDATGWLLTWGSLYYVSEWAIRISMLFVVPYRRNPESAKGWLLLMLLWPWVGLALFLLIGSTRLAPTRRKQIQRFVERVRASRDRIVAHHNIERPHVDERFMGVVKLATKLGHFPIMGGNEIELMPDYDGTIDRLIADIDAAKQHAHLLFYIYADDATGRRVGDALVRAAGRGVKCRLLVDALGSRRASFTLLPKLANAGVDVREMLKVGLFHHKSSRPDLRNHRKIAVLDGSVGYVGSQNIMDSKHFEGLEYEEMMVRVTGPVVHELQAVFCGDWYVETEYMAADASIYPTLLPAGGVACQVVPSGPSYPTHNNQRLIVSLIHGARANIAITTPYFIPDDAILQALESAVVRGVEVQLIVARQVDQWLVGHAQLSYYEDLLEAGVQVFRYGKNFLHAKYMTVDDEISLIGSSNMDIRSFALNAEISLLVFDAEVTRRLHQEQKSYLKNAEQVHLAEWVRRPLVAKLAEGVARLFSPLL